MPNETKDARFDLLFRERARTVRLRLATRHALSGFALGLAVAVVPAVVGWVCRLDTVRHAAPLLAVVGAAAGVALGRRRRWSDTEVALYLDEELATPETITTALGMHDTASDAATMLRERAVVALEGSTPAQARPRIAKTFHALAPAAAAGLVALALVPRTPPATALAVKPLVQTPITDAEGLAKVIALAHVDARDDAQRKRLEALAKDAEKLRDEVRKGLEPRAALERVARLRDAIVAERLSLGDGEARAGLESAVSKLGENAVTKRA